MCVVSMVIDHYYDRWGQWTKRPGPYEVPYPYAPVDYEQELAELQKLLERARKYDEDNNERECEMEAKKDRLKAVAKDLGFDIVILDKQLGVTDAKKR